MCFISFKYRSLTSAVSMTDQGQGPTAGVDVELYQHSFIYLKELFSVIAQKERLHLVNVETSRGL